MKHIITMLALLVVATGCESGKSGAEISALGEAAKSSQASGGSSSNGPAIDYAKRTAATLTAAMSACQAEGRLLCSMTQYQDGYQNGLVEWTVATPGNYYMLSTTTAPGAGGAARNIFQATSAGINYLQIANTNLRNFYCCANQ